MLLPQTPLFNIPELTLPRELSHIHLPVASIILSETPNLSKARSFKHFLKNLKKIANDPAILEIVQWYTIPFISQPKQKKSPGGMVMSKGKTELVESSQKDTCFEVSLVNNS